MKSTGTEKEEPQELLSQESSLILKKEQIGVPLLGILLYFVLFYQGLTKEQAGTVATVFLCGWWWVREVLPIPVTSMLPFVLLPVCGALDGKGVASAYGHPMILLLLGGFILSASLEASGVHRRIALGILRRVGSSPAYLLLGFLLTSALCSMWISNTATTLMLLPIAGAVASGRGSAPILMAIAYGASIGGMATPIGTPPNLILMAIYKESFGVELGFVEWMGKVLPVVCFLLPLTWWWLSRRLHSDWRPEVSLEASGAWRPAEWRSLLVFGCAAFLWVSRKPLWGAYFPQAGDETVALAAVIALFLIPSGGPSGGSLLSWDRAERIPWGLLILFGGGIAIAKAFSATGLSVLLGDFLAHDVGLASMSLWIAVALLALSVTFLTEVTSNTATTTLMMPILAAAGIAAGLDPLCWMLPAALSASCAFMLPVATAPNAIIFATGVVTTTDLAKTGLMLNLLGALVITCWLGVLA